ncbi:MAG: hypothetical protein AABW53_02245 [Nanoarchaeota archaeon]
MRWQEAKIISDRFSLEYIANSSYQDYLFGAEPMNNSEVVRRGLLPKGESLDGFCILVHGSVDSLPADVPKPRNPYGGLPVVYDQSSEPYERP